MARTYRNKTVYCLGEITGFAKVADKDCHSPGNIETRIVGDRVVSFGPGTFPASRWAKRTTSKQRRRVDRMVIRQALADAC